MNQADILKLASQFDLTGAPVSCQENVTGNINSTYKITCALPGGGSDQFLMQRINTYVFKDADAVMRNITLVTRHIAAAYEKMGVDATRRVLRVIHTHDGKPYFTDGEGGCWRMYNYISGAHTVDQSTSPAQFRQAGAAFGTFAHLLSDFPTHELTETIPGFHHTVRRFDTFLESVRQDKAGRVKSVQRDIDFLLARRADMGGIAAALEEGAIPLRVTHNDTKINNVMLDDVTGEAICVIDLDTVMPGSLLYDYGDGVRSGASTAPEDEADFNKVKLDVDLFEAFTGGYIQALQGSLTPAEKAMLPLSVKVITCELAMRFLTDYIDGDLYFRIRTPDHNLIRARNQMALAADIEAKFDQLQSICTKY